MFGLFNDKKKMEQEVEIIMAKYTAMCLIFKDIMYYRIGVKKEVLTQKEIEEMGQAVLDFNKTLSIVSTRVKNDFITAILGSKPAEFDLETFFEQTKIATYMQLLEEGKVELTQESNV